MSSNNKWNFSTPRVDETGPASVHGYIISISSAKPDWWIVKRLSSILKYCNEQFKRNFRLMFAEFHLMMQDFTMNCKRGRWYLKEQIPDTLIELEMLGYQNKQIFIIYWTMSRKVTFRTQQAKDDWRNSFTFSKFNKLTLPEWLLFSSPWNGKDYHLKCDNFYCCIPKKIFFMYDMFIYS